MADDIQSGMYGERWAQIRGMEAVVRVGCRGPVHREDQASVPMRAFESRWLARFPLVSFVGRPSGLRWAELHQLDIHASCWDQLPPVKALTQFAQPDSSLRYDCGATISHKRGRA